MARARQEAPAARRGSAGAYVVLAGGEPILYLERGGRGAADARRRRTTRGSSRRSRRSWSRSVAGAIKRLALEKVDGEPAMASPLGPALVALGFQEGPRRLTLSA